MCEMWQIPKHSLIFKKREESKFSSEQRLFTTAQEPGFRKRNEKEGYVEKEPRSPELSLKQRTRERERGYCRNHDVGL